MGMAEPSVEATIATIAQLGNGNNSDVSDAAMSTALKYTEVCTNTPIGLANMASTEFVYRKMQEALGATLTRTT